MSAEEAAQRLTEAAATGTPCAPVRDMVADLDQAYDAQSRFIAGRLRDGATVVGSKIGLTAPAVQRQFGVYQPDFGVLLDDMVYAHGEPVPLGRLLQPRVEGEIAFVLKDDVDRPRPTIADVLRATDFVLPAIEIVDSRIADWELTITDTVADNASSGVVVLGATPFSVTGRDLAAVGMTLELDGDEVSFGAGHACLGSPAVAVAWLARELVGRGRPLRAGDVVMSGALGPMVPITGPGRFRLKLDGLGEVATILEEAAP
ncbi:2-keto-4-pentenoate hydratase [Saccharopolyspora sp. 5N708]|uniref:2-keto-4-pentenoate hydratase n=1 Tax=Saccharopolyspora sp. 5N708 TaxID=3457424 RepID=UPI003FD2882F